MKDRRLQALRGLACLMLVLYHVIGANGNRGLRLQDGSLRLFVDILAAVRMPLFALIAGALYGRQPRTDRAALLDKFNRLMPPMLTVGTLFAFTQALVPGTNAQVTDWRLMHIVPVAHFWFLQSLFLVFALVMLIGRMGGFDRPRRFVAVFAAAATAYLSHPGFIWLGVAGALYLLPFFLGGVALTRYDWQVPLGSHRWNPIALAAFGLLVLAQWSPPGPSQDRFTPAMLASGLLLAAAFWLWPIRSAWLARIGDCSYTIFLFHVFFTAAARIGLERVGVHAIVLQVMAGMFLGVAMPMLVQRACQGSAILGFWVLGRGRPRIAAGSHTGNAVALSHAISHKP